MSPARQSIRFFFLRTEAFGRLFDETFRTIAGRRSSVKLSALRRGLFWISAPVFDADLRSLVSRGKYRVEGDRVIRAGSRSSVATAAATVA